MRQPLALCASEVAILTGGRDRPYALGLALSLARRGIRLDFIGSDDLRCPELETNETVRFLNLRGGQKPDASFGAKAWRVIRYYVRLIIYALTSRAPLFHILWNNKFELVDRTVLMFFYRLLGKRLILTVHNVNAATRDRRDTPVNRLSLRVQYALADHLIVHTEGMRDALASRFGVPKQKTSIVPFPVNDVAPETGLSRAEARRRLGISPVAKIILFFGNIAPYKGLEYLLAAVSALGSELPDVQLVVAGAQKCDSDYWQSLHHSMAPLSAASRIIAHLRYIPDEDSELYFKASDVVALPYTYIYQSGVLFLAYRYGAPVIITDVGEMKRDVVEGITGFTCRAEDSTALADAIRTFFDSSLYADGEVARTRIQQHALASNSWTSAATIISGIYQQMSPAVSGSGRYAQPGS